jgi:hypothetical protein
MNGFVHKTLVVLVLGCTLGVAGMGCGGLPSCGGPTCGASGSAGCAGGCGGGSSTAHESGYNCQLYDRCYPQRYNYLAETELNRTFAPQVLNGHILDQTVWNHHFEPTTDTLTPGGAAHLLYLSRRRPQPDNMIYLATATDLPYDPACPDQYCKAKQELDAKRAVAVQKFLAAANCAKPVDFHICVHDPADVTVSTVPMASSVTQMYARYRGGLATGGGGGAAGAAAGGGGGGGAGGAAGR